MGLAKVLRGVAVVLAIGAVAGQAGCAAKPEDTGLAAPAIGQVTDPQTAFAALNGLPLSKYGLSDQDSMRAFDAQRAFTVRCMHARGHASYTGADWISDTSPTGIAYPAGPWGYIGRADAASGGYHATVVSVAPAEPSNAATDPAADKDNSACHDEASASVMGPGTPLNGLPGRLSGAASDATLADKRYIAASGKWSDCMRKAGHDDAGKAPGGLPGKYQGAAAATPAEIAVAVADEKCTAETHLAGVYFAVTEGYEKQLERKHAKELTAHQRETDATIQRVNHILAPPTK